MSEDYVSNLQSASEKIFQSDSLKYGTKEYNIELKPLFSAFEFRTLAMTTLRSFLMFYLPLLEPRTNLEDDDDDFLQDAQEEQHVDYVAPFKKSIKQIIREVSSLDFPHSIVSDDLASILIRWYRNFLSLAFTKLTYIALWF